ncbi:hypothetical protein HK101_008351, partial [Irineochytrium annulatum]
MPTYANRHWAHLVCVYKGVPKTLATLSARAEATLIGTAARVVIHQSFDASESKGNVSTEAVYRFPLPENAAVCAFECEVDDRKIVGLVKEKEQARTEYKEAVKAGKSAGLLEEEDADVFQVSLGNIQGKVMRTRITYVQDYASDTDDEEIRFAILSKQLANRYGHHQPAETLSSDVSAQARVDASTSSDTNEPVVSITLNMPGPILSLQSPSHAAVAVSLGSTTNDQSDYMPNKARLELDAESGALPDKELVLVAKVKGMNQPTCVAERHPLDGTTALSVTLVPRFALNEIRTEIVVLVDRSGSMAGSKMDQARKALQVLLRSMAPGAFFNIISFGSDHSSLFPKSREYNADSLKIAEKHVDKMDANMGGTEIFRAVEAAIGSRREDMPTQLMLLTDGEVWDVNTLLDYVKGKVEAAEKVDSGAAFLRCFTLGIGNDVSHHLVEGIARCGGGFAQFVGSAEKLQAKVIKMLKAAVHPPIKFNVDWTEGVDVSKEDFEMVEAHAPEAEKPKPTISLFSATAVPPPPPALEPIEINRRIQQAPYHVPSLWPGTRFTVYAILDPSVPVPKHVTVTGVSPDGPLNLKVPVSASVEGTLVHILAARMLIRDIDDGRSYLKDAMKIKGPLPGTVAKDEIVRLGLKFSLASKHTSFLAVDEVVDPNVERPAKSHAHEAVIMCRSSVVEAAEVLNGGATVGPTLGLKKRS